MLHLIHKLEKVWNKETRYVFSTLHPGTGDGQSLGSQSLIYLTNQKYYPEQLVA